MIFGCGAFCKLVLSSGMVEREKDKIPIPIQCSVPPLLKVQKITWSKGGKVTFTNYLSSTSVQLIRQGEILQKHWSAIKRGRNIGDCCKQTMEVCSCAKHCLTCGEQTLSNVPRLCHLPLYFSLYQFPVDPHCHMYICYLQTCTVTCASVAFKLTL